MWRSLVCHNHYPVPDCARPARSPTRTPSSRYRRTTTRLTGPRGEEFTTTTGRSSEVAPTPPSSTLTPQIASGVQHPDLLRARSRPTSPRSGGRSATGSSTSSISGRLRQGRALRRLRLQPRGERVRGTRFSSRSRRSTASLSTSTRGRSSSSSATSTATHEFVASPPVTPTSSRSRRATPAPTSAARPTRTSPPR